MVRPRRTLRRGQEVKTAGDGIFTTFDHPSRAMLCALAMARAPL